jgi:hypothetical protein
MRSCDNIVQRIRVRVERTPVAGALLKSRQLWGVLIAEAPPLPKLAGPQSRSASNLKMSVDLLKIRENPVTSAAEYGGRFTKAL